MGIHLRLHWIAWAMTPNNPIDPESRRYREAVDWLFCLQEDRPTNEQIIEWVEWCSADAENRRAFERLIPAWMGLESFRDDPETTALLIAERLGASSYRSKSEPGPTGASATGVSVISPSARRPYRWLALAASMILVAGAAYLWQASRVETLAPLANLASAVGQTRKANLPDGSRLDLGGRSELAVDFEGNRRQIDLKQGEAFFAVRHDKTHPFIVEAGSLRVVAVGTAFDVLRNGKRVIVTVGEGVVEAIAEVSTPPDGAPTDLRVSGGSQLVFDEANPGKPILRPVNPQSAGAWRQGRFEYIDEPLCAVIANLDRYSARAISIEDQQVGRLAFTGTIELHSIDEWLQALPRIFPVHVVYRSNHTITIQP